MRQQDKLYILQISDTHIVPEGRLLSGHVDTKTCLDRAVTHIKQLYVKPQAVMVTGDIVDDGSFASYQQFKALLEGLDIPVYVLAGNHDERQNLLAAFPGLPLDAQMKRAGFIQYVVNIAGVRVIALDTQCPGYTHGELCEERLSWLRGTLAQEPNMPCVVAMHHPPFKTGLVFMDTARLLRGADELARMIRQYPQVQRIICGHVHRLCMQQFAGVTAVTTPSVAHQMALQLSPHEPVAYTFEPPGGLLHVWQKGQAGITTHLMTFADFAGPFRL